MTWQKILAQGFATSKELLDFLNLPQTLGSDDAHKLFKVKVPRGFAMRMQKSKADDPLLRQVLATQDELSLDEHFEVDPLKENNVNKLAGMLHKYQGRVLLTLTGICAINCRYCFRRHFPYKENNPGRQGWLQVIDYIKADPSIKEVIFSGGDPLMATNSLLAMLINELDQIPHVKILRFHSRMPIVLPERIDQGFLDCLSKTRLTKVMVLHCNHPQELSKEVKEACERLRSVDCHLLNQSVLLKGINDSVEILRELSEQLFEYQVLPYYLHILDKVKGVSHFDLPLSQALVIYRELQGCLPGYLLPKLSREDAGEKSKTLLV